MARGLAFYELLGCQPDASAEEIRKAYKRAALKCHPDKGGRAEDFQELNRAYTILNDPYKRQVNEVKVKYEK